MGNCCIPPANYKCNTKSYGFFAFIGDVIMTIITCGFWLIYIFCREMRKQ